MEKSQNLMHIAIAICAIAVAFLAIIFGITNLISNKSSNVNSITISGNGEVLAVPNAASITINVKAEDRKISDAAKIVNGITAKLIKEFSAISIEEKDVKTQSYNANPKYDYPPTPPCSNNNCPPKSNPVFRGYEVTQSLSVKIKDINNVEPAFDILAKLQIADFNGPNFIVDNEEKYREEARTKAIKDAKTKATKIAKELGIKLIKITSFSENYFGGYQPRMALMKANADASNSSINPGENTINSNVTITYEVE